MSTIFSVASRVARLASLSGLLLVGACSSGTVGFFNNDDGSTVGGSTPGGSGIPAFLTLEAAQTDIVADGVTSTAIAATLTDTSGLPISGADIDFSTTAGTLSENSGVTNSNGQVLIFLKSAAKSGQATVTAMEPVTSTAGTVVVRFIPGAVTKITMTAAPTTVAPGGATSVTVRVLDAHDNGVAGKTVRLNATTGTGAYSGSTTVTSDSAGTIVTSFSPTASTSLSATSVDENITSTAVAITVDPNATVIGDMTLSAIVASAPADGTSAVIVRARLLNTDGDPAQNYPVSFSASAGSPSTQTVNTLANGNAEFSLTSVTPGSVTIMASSGGLSRTVTVAFTGSAAVNAISLLASSSQLQSGSSSGVTITALVKDVNNNAISGAAVSFSSARASGTSCGQGGALAVQGAGLTDASGAATAILTTSGDSANQTIHVTASAGGHSASLDIGVSGTRLQLSGNSSVGVDEILSNYKVTLTDSFNQGLANQAVTIGSSKGNLGTGASNVSSITVTTDASGQATFSYRGRNSGTDTLTASLGAGCASTSQLTVNVAAVNLSVTSPTAGTEIPFSNTYDTSVTVHLTGGNPGVDSIDFFTSRGLFDDGGTGSNSINVVTDGSGNATATLKQPAGVGAAGQAIISAVESSSGVSASVTVQFTSVTPEVVELQASPTAVAINGTSILTAVVRDQYGNLVDNARVNFTLSDGTGGSLSAPTGVTSLGGSVTTVYTATGTPSATNGVDVKADVLDSGNAVVDSDTIEMTVGGSALRLTLGTGNTLSVSGITYKLPYQVQVTDSSGNPPPAGTKVKLQIDTLAYQKGVLQFNSSQSRWEPYPDTDDTSDPGFAVTGADVQTPDASLLIAPASAFGCVNEDFNRNGILDSGEDDPTAGTNPGNGNGFLDPSNAASVPSLGSTDDDGLVNFNVTYAKDRSQWTQVRLTASAGVAGSESVTFQDFVLPVAGDESNEITDNPPAKVSPYGTGSDCINPN